MVPAPSENGLIDQDDDFFHPDAAAERVVEQKSRDEKLVEPEYIYVCWEKRKWGNKIARLIYMFVKTMYATFWYYFAPFSCLYLSFFLPYMFAGYQDIELPAQ